MEGRAENPGGVRGDAEGGEYAPGDGPDLSARAAILAVSTFFLAGLALRLAFWLEFSKSDVRFLLESPTMDSFIYHSWAEKIASGDLLLAGEGLLTLSPFYSYLLAVIYAIAGSGMFTAILVQLLLGAVGVVLIYLAGSLLFSRMAGVLAAGLTAFYGQYLFTEGLLLSEAFLPFFTALFICWTAWALEKGKPPLFIVSGLLLGVLFSIRPQFFLVVLLLPLFGLAASSRKGAEARRGMLKILAFGALGAALTVAPLAIRNYAVSDEVVLLTTAGGVNFYIGNNPEATGTWMVPSGFDTTQQGMFEGFAAKAGGGEYDSSHSRTWLLKGLEYIADDPLGWSRLMLKKAALFWNDYEVPVNFDFALMRGDLASSRVAFVPFFVVGSLGIVGLWLAVRQRKARWLVVVVIGHFAGTILFFISARYRVAAVPGLVLFSGFALHHGIQFFRERDWRALSRWVVALALALYLSLLPLAGELPPAYRADQCRSVGHGLIRNGEWERAERWIRNALEITPGDPVLWRDFAQLCRQMGRHTEAREAMRRSEKLSSGRGR